MNLGEPIAESTMTVTSVQIENEVTTLTYEGEVGKYGQAFGTHHLRPSDLSRETYVFEGSGRTLLPDGSMLSASLRGIGRRSGGIIKLFSLDNVSNGDQNFSIIEVDALGKTASVKVYSV
ncbi:MAG TPA: hypothetical protein QF572_16360 [Vicinamibacterales bacterium]|nr:hypothetical protein [Vicinamibacterales bacterium]